LKGIEQEIAELLKLHRGQLESLAQALLEQETLAADEIQSILKQTMSL
ncbi:MAG: hypothetical protein GY792_07655, partial [Gammaproteobacteria bacterium]|nr:hypothetical protein [Gammaproteobacteria bacterium]